MEKKRDEKRKIKNKKMLVQKLGGLLPNCIAKGKDFVLQYNQCIASWKA